MFKKKGHQISNDIHINNALRSIFSNSFTYLFFLHLICLQVHAKYCCVYNLTKSIDVCCSGWLFKLEVKNMDELKALMDEKAYKKYLETYDSDDEYQPI